MKGSIKLEIELFTEDKYGVKAVSTQGQIKLLIDKNRNITRIITKHFNLELKGRSDMIEIVKGILEEAGIEIAQNDKEMDLLVREKIAKDNLAVAKKDFSTEMSILGKEWNK